jgi:hypothetical protein
MDAADIYPQIWNRDGSEGLKYLLNYYDALVRFYQQAARENRAVIQYIN